MTLNVSPNGWWMQVDVPESLGVREEPGWEGVFTRQQAPQAKYPNGSRVCKTRSKLGDTYRDGAKATVLGSLYADGVGCLYFVEFDARPRVVVAIAYSRLRAGYD